MEIGEFQVCVIREDFVAGHSGAQPFQNSLDWVGNTPPSLAY